MKNNVSELKDLKFPHIVWYGLCELSKSLDTHLALLNAYYDIMMEKYTFDENFENYISTTVDAVYSQLLLEIARFFDPAKQMSNTNCSLFLLKQLLSDNFEKRKVKAEEKESLFIAISTLEAAYNETSIPAFRRKRLAHNDLDDIFDFRNDLPKFKEINALINQINNVIILCGSYIFPFTIQKSKYEEEYKAFKNAFILMTNSK